MRPTLPHAFALSVALAALTSCAAPGPPLEAVWDDTADRTWVGPQFWANRLQDWRVRGGRIECVGTSLPMRTLHLTTSRVGFLGEQMRTSVRLGLSGEAAPAGAAAGVLIGAGASDLDWRAACLVQSAPGPDGGWFAGVTPDGRLFLRDNSGVEDEISVALEPFAGLGEVVLSALVEDVDGPTCILRAEARDAEGTLLGQVSHPAITDVAIAGNLALVADPSREEDRATFWFDDWTVEGSMIDRDESRTVGPVISAMHTLSRGKLKLTAQLMPVGTTEPRSASLELKLTEGWTEVDRATVDRRSFTAAFSTDYDPTRGLRYRVVYGDDTYGGKIRHDPVEKRELVLAALSCNHLVRHGFGNKGYPWNDQALWFPHNQITDSLKFHDPDVLFFAGDQIYEGSSPTPPERRDDPGLDYLYKWTLFCLAFRDLTRDIPTITIPDDHDVYQGNLWGAGGRAAKRDNQGGYVMPAEWVRMVERTQTSHLPDPVDPTPVDQGIGVYYTDMVYGRVGMAILEDRKFKSGCAELELGGPRPDHIVDASFDPGLADGQDLTLLGERQLTFLRAFAEDWRGQDMKLALSQTVFANVATHHGRGQNELVADLDSNGWPQSGRDRALAELRRSFALHVAGDQHLATLVKHGIEDFNDATWSFTMPAIANFYARAWRPEGPPAVALEGLPDYTGSRLDGLGNRVTVWAAANPDGPTGREPAALHDQMPGYGIVRVDKRAREYVVECWPRGATPPKDAQYAGWPMTIPQTDCYGRTPAAWLPELVVEGVEQPVFQVFDDEGELVYALRAPGPRFHPWVFEFGNYQVRIGDPDTGRMTQLMLGAGTNTDETIRVHLEPAPSVESIPEELGYVE